MRDGDPDDALDAPRDHGARNAALAVAALVVAAAGAWAVNDRFDRERRARELHRAAEAWSDLSRCLAGDAPRVGAIARTARRAWLRVPSSARSLPRDERMRAWPWRCAPYARTMTRALFESRSDEPAHRLLAQFVSIAATELGRGELRTARNDPRHYLDELFAAASRADLPRAHTSTVLPPPEPMRVLDPARVRPLFRGAGSSTLAAEEAFDGGALRVVLGRAERRLCDLDRDLDAPECARVPVLDAAARVQLTAARYPSAPGYVVRDARGLGTLLHPSHPEAPLSASVAGAYRVARDQWITLGESAGAYALARDGASLALPALAYAAPPALLGDVVVATVSAPPTTTTTTPDAGVAPPEARVLAGAFATVGPLRWGAAPVERATLRAAAGEVLARGCQLDAAMATVLYGDDGHAAVLWWRDGRFERALTADARPGSLTCSDGRVRMAWYATTALNTVHVTTCTPERCTHAEAPAPLVDGAPRVVALGERVLVAYTGEALGGLRYRYGPLATIADARETVVFDDAAHEGVDLEASPVLVARGDVAALFVTRKEAPHETWAVRLDAQGFRALRARE